ncbi:MAG: adaptor protein MecA, partial [Hominilimicola sp.]
KANSRHITRQQFINASSVKAKLKKSAKTKIFYFDSFDDLCSALKELDTNSLLAGFLYRLNDTYCFTINNEPAYEKCLNLMSEFAPARSGYPLQMTYIEEHGQLVAKGAQLLEMAEKIRQLT